MILAELNYNFLHNVASAFAGVMFLARLSYPWTWVGIGVFSSIMPIICMSLVSPNTQPCTAIDMISLLSELVLIAASFTGKTYNWLFASTYIIKSLLLACVFITGEFQTNNNARFFAHVVISWAVIEPRAWKRFLTNAQEYIQISKQAVEKLFNNRNILSSSTNDIDYEYTEMLSRFYLDPTKSYFLLQAVIRMSWIHLSPITITSIVLKLVVYYRKLLLIQILGTFASGSNSNTLSFWPLTFVWVISHAANIALDYTEAKRKRLVDKIRNVIRTKVTEMYLSKNCSYDELNFSIERCNGLINLFSYYLTVVLDMTLEAIIQLFGLYIIISTIGWTSALPIGLAVLIVGISIKADTWLELKRKALYNNRKHIFQEKASTMFQNMRTIKQYAWESKLLSTIKHRSEYPKLAWYERALHETLQRIRLCTSEIVAIIALTLHMQNGARVAYVDLTKLLYEIGELTSFARSLKYVSNYVNSFRDIDNELLKIFECHKLNYISRMPAVKPAENSIDINNCLFSWGENKFQLQPLSLTVKHGEFVTVIGKVGSGKSSLLSAICGEMPLTSGSGCVYGTIGYVSQKPWIMNATVRENVLFGSRYNEERYSQVIKACALADDLRQLPAQDQTEIGSKGVNLSGGQKVRLALARAIYSNADIYILDDILSAVDAQVERHIIEYVLARNGIISGKTRILVTHADHVIPLSCQTLRLENGYITVSQREYAEFSKVTTDNSIAVGNFDASTTDNEKTSKFNISPELNVSQFDKAMFWKFVVLSGFTVVAISLIVEFAQAHVSFSAGAKQREFFKNNKLYITSQALQRYLMLDMLIKLATNELLSLGHEFQAMVWGMQIRKKMRAEFTKRLAYTSLSVFERLSTHTILDIYENELTMMPVNLPIFMCIYVKQIFDSIYSLYGLFRMNSYMIIFVIPFAYIVLRINKLHQFALEQQHRKEKAQPININEYIGELIDGHEVVRIHNKNNKFIKRLHKVYTQHMSLKSMTPLIIDIDSAITKTVYQLVELSTILYARWIFANSSVSPSPSDIRAWIDLCSSGVSELSAVLEGFRDNMKMLPMLAKYFVYTEQLEQEAPHVVDTVDIPESWPENGIIEFNNYSLRYHDNLDTVLNSVIFSTCKHEKIGIVGRTGAGKSSLTFALLRLIEPSGGSITIDGLDISTIGLHDLRSRISVVPQDPMLLEGTIRDNLDPTNEYTDGEIWEAVSKAHISDMLVKSNEKQPHSKKDIEDTTLEYKYGIGLNTWVESNGRNFSVGQRQLISLCRALLWKRSILILDEATANIDSKTDETMQEIIRKEFKHCTVLTIAHRLNTVMDSNRILVMEQGKVAEFDTPDNLLARKSRFAQLVKSMQFNTKTLQ